MTHLLDTLKAPTTWSHVEVCVALISACLPTMRPLLTMFMKAIGLERSQGPENASVSERYARVDSRKESTAEITASENTNGEFDMWSTSTRQDSRDEAQLDPSGTRQEHEQHSKVIHAIADG